MFYEFCIKNLWTFIVTETLEIDANHVFQEVKFLLKWIVILSEIPFKMDKLRQVIFEHKIF